jgi:hypothetical protein
VRGGRTTDIAHAHEKHAHFSVLNHDVASIPGPGRRAVRGAMPPSASSSDWQFSEVAVGCQRPHPVQRYDLPVLRAQTVCLPQCLHCDMPETLVRPMLSNQRQTFHA